MKADWRGEAEVGRVCMALSPSRMLVPACRRMEVPRAYILVRVGEEGIEEGSKGGGEGATQEFTSNITRK